MAKRIVPLVPSPAVPLNEVDEVDEVVDEIEEPTGAELLKRPDEDSEKLAAFLELFDGKEYKVRVEQYEIAERCWAHVDTFHVDGFEPYEVCKRFGPGRYRMTFLNEHGRRVRGSSPQVRIGGKAAVPAPTQAAIEQDPLKHPLVAMLLANAEAQRRESSELIRALLTKPEPVKSSSMEVIELFKSMRSLNPEDSGMKKMQEALMMKMIEKGLEVGDSGEGGGGGILSDIKDALPILREMLAARAPQAPNRVAVAPQQPTRVQLPLEAGQPLIPEIKAQEPENVSPIFLALKPYISIFKSKAENGIDQERAANYLIDELYDSVIPLIKKHIPMASMASDETILESLIGRAKDPAQLDELFKAVPEFSAHKDYITSVVAKAVVILETPVAETANA